MIPCFTCPKGEDLAALASFRERAAAFCRSNNVTSAAIVKMNANGALTIMKRDDPRIGTDKFTLVDVVML